MSNVFYVQNGTVTIAKFKKWGQIREKIIMDIVHNYPAVSAREVSRLIPNTMEGITHLFPGDTFCEETGKLNARRKLEKHFYKIIRHVYTKAYDICQRRHAWENARFESILRRINKQIAYFSVEQYINDCSDIHDATPTAEAVETRIKLAEVSTSDEPQDKLNAYLKAHHLA